MTLASMLSDRLINQQIEASASKKPEDVVASLGAMQAQEFAMAKWAIGLRLPGCSDADVEKAFNEGRILRTHVLRPTWHFVTPANIRWLLALTAPHIHAANAYMTRKVELDAGTVKRCNDILIKSLQGKKYLTRTALNAAFKKARIVAEGLRLVYILMQAELEGIICSGPLQGKQFTYALLEERAPAAKKLQREEALAELALIYFTSRGPAAADDLAYWSGLSMKEARTGIELVRSKLDHEVMDARYFFFAPAHKKRSRLRATFLMPDYDEYGMSYKNKSVLFAPANRVRSNLKYNRMIVINGLIEGTWKRTIQNDHVDIELAPFAPLSERKHAMMVNAAKRYSRFIGKNYQGD